MSTSGRTHFVASSATEAQDALQECIRRFGQVEIGEAGVIVALGGDGFMLKTLHRFIGTGLPVYGMMLGNVGFLMNRYQLVGLSGRIEQARTVMLNPLRMKVVNGQGEISEGLAINEVSLLRQTNQTAHIRIFVNDSVKVRNLMCDGVLLATAAGSTAYNLSIRGPILPLGTDALALTPISPFRPRRWSGAILPCSARVRFEILDAEKRPVSATADSVEVRDVVSVEIVEDKSVTLNLLFDPGHSLEEKILHEQFL
jgi:NAD+ kinase